MWMGCRDERPTASTGPSSGQVRGRSPTTPEREMVTDPHELRARPRPEAMRGPDRRGTLAQRPEPAVRSGSLRRVDSMRFSTIAHRAHQLCNPLDEPTLDAACARLDLDAPAGGPARRVIDVGCGKAELLVRLAERHGIEGIGIDVNPWHLADGSDRAARRGVGRAITLLEVDASRFDAGPASFDAAISIGAAHALGGYAEALDTLATWVRPAGRLLVGHGYWRREPAPEYLAALGATRDEHGTHEDNRALAAARGLRPLDAWESDREAWDRYEDLYAGTALAYAEAHPDDPDAEAIVARVTRWREAYRAWGRDTLGFGLYVFER